VKLDYQEIHHHYITRLVVFAIFLFREQRRQENVYRQSVINFIKRRIRYDIELSIEVGPKLALEDQRDMQIETLLNNFDESNFLNLVVVEFRTGFKERITLQINLNDEERYESYLYS
jgi:hypothetical protein